MVAGARIALDRLQLLPSGALPSDVDKTWGIKSAAVREGFYNDMVELYSRTGIVPDELINNVVRFVQETRKTQENIAIGDITDWSFAKKANEQLKR